MWLHTQIHITSVCWSPIAPQHLNMNHLISRVAADSGVSQPDEPTMEAWQLGMPFSVETKEGHAEAGLSPLVMPNPLRKPSNALQVLATPAWPM